MESGYESAIADILSAHSLSDSLGRLIAVETLFVLTGLESAADFAESIEREAELPHDTARMVANEVGLRVFSPFREKLQTLSLSEIPTTGDADTDMTPQANQDRPGYTGGDPYREPVE